MSAHKINIAVMGCGYWGKNLVRNFHNIGALYAVCDPDKVQAQRFAAEYSVLNLSVEEILEDNNIEGVTIAAPAKLHYKLAKQALEHGKHVFVEKPLSLSTEEGEELCRLAENQNLILMVGHLLHYHSAYQKLKSLVQKGDLGDLRYIYSNRLNLGKIRREEDILWSFAPHDISMILDLMEDVPINVSAEGGFYLSPDIADVTTTHLEFSGGKQAHVFVSWLHPFKEQKLAVVGSKAMAVFIDGEPWDKKLQLYKHSIDVTQSNIPSVDQAQVEYVAIEQTEPLKNECSHFVHCIKTGQTPKTDGQEGLRVLRVLETSSKAILKNKEKATGNVKPFCA